MFIHFPELNLISHENNVKFVERLMQLLLKTEGKKEEDSKKEENKKE